MIIDLDAYDYIISIDLGNTFSGSCYTCTKEKDAIVHVTEWPHQETFEKTPSVCLYDTTQHPPAMIEWGQAAMDHATLYPNDANTLLISDFKLKLFNLDSTTDAATTDLAVSYRTAAVDYLRAIHTYTLQQFLQNNPIANEAQVRYVLTIPATWMNNNSEDLRQIAIEANIVSASEPEAIQKARLAVLSEAHAASLFCEREYCATSVTQLFKGQRYTVVDLGGVTAALATYECTENGQEHCQLASESMDVCGSTILDQHMKSCLKDEVFFGYSNERLFKLLIEQFKTEIKHCFGEDSGYVPPATKQAVEPDITGDTHLMAVTETKVPTYMMDYQQDGHDYNAFEDSYCSDDFTNDALDEREGSFKDNAEDFEGNQEDANSDFERFHEADVSNGEIEEQYIYLSLPPNFEVFLQPWVIENLRIRKDLTATNQIRVSHTKIAKHVFDPVVGRVTSLIRENIRESGTTIDILFLLGGFSQSPYLQKKLHEEFVTNASSVQRIIVPENGYRASMRGGIHYGLDCAKAIPEYYLKDKAGNLIYNNCNRLVSIDFNFDEMTAMYSIIKLNDYSKSLLTSKLKKKIRSAGINLGMLKESGSEARFALDWYEKHSYYIRNGGLENMKNYEASKVFVFHLSFAEFASLYKPNEVQSRLSSHSSVNLAAAMQAQKRGLVEVHSMERGSLLSHNAVTFFEELDFAGILQQEPETFLTSAVEILDLIAAGNFPVHHLLTFLGTETDFMSSEHVRDYVKQQVDLSRPDTVHIIGDVFMEPNTDNVVSIGYQQASGSMKTAIEYAILVLKNMTFTTKHVTELLLLPWIRRVLAPVVMKAHSNVFKRSEAYIQHSTAVRESVFVFPAEQIIQTNYQSQHQRFLRKDRQDSAAYLFEALKREIKRLTLSRSLPSDNEIHNLSENDAMYEDPGCIINVVHMPRQQEATRTARRTYAIQFFKYFVQRPSQAAAVVQGQADAQDAQAEDGGPSNRQEINISTQDYLTLYPLIQKDANLATECYTLGSNRYCIQDKCSVAAVLYVSDEIPLPDQYYTSNMSFRKLHRFIIPIEDPTQPIRIQCTPEDYSILFTVSQGDGYKDGFRCNDLMYYG